MERSSPAGRHRLDPQALVRDQLGRGGARATRCEAHEHGGCAQRSRHPRDVHALAARSHGHAVEAQHLAGTQLVDRERSVDREVGAGDQHGAPMFHMI